MDIWLITSIALFIIGMLFVMAEVAMPSGGLLGLCALLGLVGSVVAANNVSGMTAIIMGGVEAVCVPTAVILLFRILPKTSFGKMMFLTPETKHNAANPPTTAAAEQPLSTLLGQEGVVVTPLRPSGVAEFDNRRVSVVSDGVVVDVGRRVRVVLVEGARVVIETIED